MDFAKISPRVETRSFLRRFLGELVEYVSVAEATHMLGESPGTIKTLASNGKIPTHRNMTNGCLI